MAPGKPMQNEIVASFNGSFYDAYHNETLFLIRVLRSPH
ncbi:integrase core domain-containing protein [Ochrobactrum sp. MYb379]